MKKVALLAALTLALSAVASQPKGWGRIERPDFTVSEAELFVDNAARGRSGHMGHALIDCGGGRILAFDSNVPTNRCDGHSGYGWMEYRVSSDYGRTWGASRVLDYSKKLYDEGRHTALCEKGVLTADGRVVLFFQITDTSNPISCEPWFEPTFVESRDFGETWSEPKRACPDRGRIYDAVVDSDSVYFLLPTGADFCSTNQEYVVYKSTDGGPFVRHLTTIEASGKGYGAMEFTEDGSLVVYAYDPKDEAHPQYCVSRDRGETWEAPRRASCAKLVRNPQMRRVGDDWFLCGRNGGAGDGLVLYHSKDGFSWDEGIKVDERPAGTGTGYYSCLLPICEPGRQPRVLIQYSHPYRGSCVNVMHRWIDLKRKETAEVPRWLNVPPLLEGHEEEIAADQRWLYENTVIDSSAFIVTLTPEGDPAFDKAGVYVPQLMKMKELLKGSKGKFGIQFQATIGHGWVPDSRTPWQKFVSPDGTEPYIFCPLGKEFRAYLQDQVSKLAEVRPDFFMVDDDTRFITCRNGCFCPLHLAEMKKRTGRAWTRESLVEALKTDATLARTYDRLLEDSIVELVRTVRTTFDKVNPAIVGTFCCCACDVRHASRIARTAAASGQRPVVRLNNGRYCNETARTIPDWLHKTALQLSTIDPDVIVLDEPDTCPQNRYSMSARDLNCHIAMSLLEGCRGAKIWVTRMGQWEPKSGVAYRETLASHRGFYSALAELSPTWEGVRIPLPAEGYFSLTSYGGFSNWGESFFGRTGIAYANTKEAMPLTALSGCDSELLTDADVRTLLAGKLILDGAGALALTRRGFAKNIGCRAEKWTGPVASFEMLADGKTRINSKPDAVRLVDVDPKATVLSTYHHREAAISKNSVRVAPGAIRFHNELGGDVIVVADTLPKSVGLDAFHFYNETRKEQIVGFLRQLGYVAPYYPGDAEILLKWGCDKDGNRLLAVLNTGHDAISDLPLVFADEMCPSSAERLGSDGRWQTVPVRKADARRVILASSVDFIIPAVFRLK